MGPGSMGVNQVVRVEADQLEVFQGNLVILRRGDSPVAAVQLYQVVAAYSRSWEARGTYEVIPEVGSSVVVPADRMEPEQNGMMSFYAGDRLVGIANANGVRMIVERGRGCGGREGPGNLQGSGTRRA